MIKLVILIDVLEDIKGGAERQVYELIKGIDKDKFDLNLIILHQKKVPQEISNLGGKVSALGIKRIYGLNGIIKGLAFRDFLKREKTDILLTYHFGSDIWGAWFGKLAKVPLIISFRRDDGFWRGLIHVLAYKLINCRVNKIFTVSQAVKNKVIKDEGIAENKVEVIYSGIDQERFKTNIDVNFKKHELGLPARAFIIGTVGNLRPIKGHKFLIDAAFEIVHKLPNAYFLFAGDGELKENLIAQTKKWHIEKNILFLGKRDDVPELISIMDICVLPSLSEGLSNTLLEFMAAAKPVIATAVGGNIEVIEDEKNGLLVPAGDSRQLIKQITRLIDNSALARQLGQNAKQTVERKFKLRSQIQALESLLQQELTVRTHQKIMHLISSGGLFGAEKVMLNIAEANNANSHGSWVIGLRNSRNPHEEVVDEAKNRNIPAKVIESNGRFDFGAINRLTRFMRENNIGILHTHNYKANFIGFWAAKRAKVPIVATLHGYIGNGRKLRLYESIDRFILLYFDRVILVDNSLKKWFKNGTVKYEVINNGIKIEETPRQSGAKRSLPVGDHVTKSPSGSQKELVIGTVGRLSEEKGHKYLIEAFARLVKEYSNVRLLIVGDGELRAKLEQLSETLSIKEKVTFAGYQKDVVQYYALMDIYVSPSLVEHFPMSILEAMSFGKATVATDVGGTEDLIKDKETGMLINAASSEAIYQALLQYLHKPALLESIRKNAQQFIKENYSLDKMLASYNKAYSEFLK